MKTFIKIAVIPLCIAIASLSQACGIIPNEDYEFRLGWNEDRMDIFLNDEELSDGEYDFKYGMPVHLSMVARVPGEPEYSFGGFRFETPTNWYPETEWIFQNPYAFFVSDTRHYCYACLVRIGVESYAVSADKRYVAFRYSNTRSLEYRRSNFTYFAPGDRWVFIYDIENGTYRRVDSLTELRQYGEFPPHIWRSVYYNNGSFRLFDVFGKSTIPIPMGEEVMEDASVDFSAFDIDDERILMVVEEYDSVYKMFPPDSVYVSACLFLVINNQRQILDTFPLVENPFCYSRVESAVYNGESVIAVLADAKDSEYGISLFDLDTDTSRPLALYDVYTTPLLIWNGPDELVICTSSEGTLRCEAYSSHTLEKEVLLEFESNGAHWAPHDSESFWLINDQEKILYSPSGEILATLDVAVENYPIATGHFDYANGRVFWMKEPDADWEQYVTINPELWLYSDESGEILISDYAVIREYLND